MNTRHIALTVLGLICLFLSAILAAVDLVGTDAELYYREQTKSDILPFAGVSEGDLRLLDTSLAAYLRGTAETLDSLTVEVFGTAQSAFNARELTHLRDCANLFRLARIVECVLAGLAVLFVFLGTQRPHKAAEKGIRAVFLLLLPLMWMLRLDRLAALIALALCGASLLRARQCAATARASWIAAAITLLPFTVFAVWACLNFDQAFTFFHHRLFTNDLWLLDPRTDLLIRICPEQMFMDMGMRIGLYSLAVIVGIPALLTCFSIMTNRSHSRNKSIQEEEKMLS